MFYYGLRSSIPYLTSLEDVRTRGGRMAVTSVIGGFAFLHALHPGVEAITLVDVDLDAVRHWRLMARLIDTARSLPDFVSLLAGGHPLVGAVTSDGLAFGPRVDPRPRLAGVLPPDLLALYEQTYGAMVLTAGVGHIPPSSTVHFTGFDLTPMHFCWHVGTGNLRDEASFGAMQAVLRRAAVTVHCGTFETLDFAVSSAGLPSHVFLASNCESPLFTRHDAIFAQVVRTAAGPVRYISWVRDGWIEPGMKPPPAAVVDLTALPFERAHTLTLPGGALPEPLRAAAAAAPAFSGPDDPRLRNDYCHELLILAGGARATAMQLLADIAPNVCRVVWVRGDEPEAPSEAVQTRYRSAPTSLPGTDYFELRALRTGLLI